MTDFPINLRASEMLESVRYPTGNTSRDLRKRPQRREQFPSRKLPTAHRSSHPNPRGSGPPQLSAKAKLPLVAPDNHMPGASTSRTRHLQQKTSVAILTYFIPARLVRHKIYRSVCRYMYPGWMTRSVYRNVDQSISVCLGLLTSSSQ